MYLGIDTSNYTTSVALYDGERIRQWKQLLAVKPGERGLRQSDALFQHVNNLPKLMQAMEQEKTAPLQAVGVSERPRNLAGSYMPCFLAGCCAGASAAAAAGVPLYRTSHQVGHILAALYSVQRLELIDRPFLAFHVSGGTTEALLVTPDSKELIRAQLVAESSDLKAGQAVDRVGVSLGLQFPAGQAMDELAQASGREYKIRPSFSGANCSLSGIENQCRRLAEQGAAKEEIARFCILSICAALDRMTELLLEQYGELPLLFAGGVMSNSLISSRLQKKYSALFAESAYSCDNAAGIAIQAYLKHQKRMT